jgi:hypothetical protein
MSTLYPVRFILSRIIFTLSWNKPAASYSFLFYPLSRFCLTVRGLYALEFGDNLNGAIKMQYFKRAAIVVFLGACLYLAGNADFEEAQRQEAQYISDFCAGVIPDYKGTRPACGGAK